MTTTIKLTNENDDNQESNTIEPTKKLRAIKQECTTKYTTTSITIIIGIMIERRTRQIRGNQKEHEEEEQLDNNTCNVSCLLAVKLMPILSNVTCEGEGGATVGP